MTNDANRNKIIDKVQKLLALSTSSNEHEAALAAERVQEILLRYNLTLSDVQGEKSGYEWQQKNVSGATWKRNLLYYIATYNLCDAVLEGDHKSLHIVGKPHNVEVVLYLHTYLVREINRLAKASVPLRWKAKEAAWIRAFAEGAASTIYQRLKEASEAAAAAANDCRALIVVNKADLEQAVKDRFAGDLRHLGGHRSRVISSAFDKGRTEGHNIPLNQGVGGASTRTKFIG